MPMTPERGVEDAKRAAGRNPPVALERRHDDFFLLADEAVGRDQLRGVDVAAVVLFDRAGTDQDVDVVCSSEFLMQGDAAAGQIGDRGEGGLEARRHLGSEGCGLLDGCVLGEHQKLGPGRRPIGHPLRDLVLPCVEGGRFADRVLCGGDADLVGANFALIASSARTASGASSARLDRRPSTRSWR